MSSDQRMTPAEIAKGMDADRQRVPDLGPTNDILASLMYTLEVLALRVHEIDVNLDDLAARIKRLEAERGDA